MRELCRLMCETDITIPPEHYRDSKKRRVSEYKSVRDVRTPFCPLALEDQVRFLNAQNSNDRLPVLENRVLLLISSVGRIVPRRTFMKSWRGSFGMPCRVRSISLDARSWFFAASYSCRVPARRKNDRNTLSVVALPLKGQHAAWMCG